MTAIPHLRWLSVFLIDILPRYRHGVNVNVDAGGAMCQGLNEDDVRALMRQEIKRRGSQAAWARSIGETPQGVSVMLLHRKPVGRVLEALGLEERATFYVKGSTNNDSIA